MSSAPWFRLYFSDLAGDTLHLSDAEMGSYVLLIGAMWNAGGRLDLDPASLARIARCPPGQWAKRWARLGGFFTVEGGQLTHGRVAAERAAMGRKRAANAASGALGGRASALKRRASAPANACIPLRRNPGENPANPESRVQKDADAGSGAIAGAGRWPGPAQIREAVAGAQGEAWTATWLDPCGWRPDPPAVTAPRPLTRRRLELYVGHLLAERGVALVLEGPPSQEPAA
ncbi:MAG: DUF1376 domain-containing protein [Caulobacteraceae bacterium]|nr:DUF1376 domain-containing protein [Caulobacteraceae bacterium]